MKAEARQVWLLWLLALVIVGIDQYTKWLVVTHLQQGVPYTVFTGFDLLLSYNDGAAFSFLNGAGGWQRWLLTGISVAVSAGVAVWLWKLPRQQKLLASALVFVLGGALGNLWDRAATGLVVDFISLYYGEWRFATFNIADSAISCGAVLLGIDVLFGSGRHD